MRRDSLNDIMRLSMDNPLGPHTNYTVRTPIYEGPLDLLLDLIERAELDITTISLAMVTDQYLDFIRSLDEAHPDEISAFLVIAARLLQIKSEALLPRPPAGESSEEDVGQSLVDQLRLYKRFKEIGLWLDVRQRAGLQTYLRIAPTPKLKPRFDPSGLTLDGLLAAAAFVFARLPESEPLGSVISIPKVTIREKIDLITRSLKQLQHTSFRRLLGDTPTRLEIVVTFLALLELIKRYRVQAQQDTLFGDIDIQRLQEWGDDEDTELEFE